MTSVREQWACGISVLHIEGQLRVPVTAELRRSVQTLLQRGARSILLDLSAVSALDAGGLGELVRVYNMTTAAHGSLRIVHSSTEVRVLLDRAGLFDLFSTNSGRSWLEAS